MASEHLVNHQCFDCASLFHFGPFFILLCFPLGRLINYF